MNVVTSPRRTSKQDRKRRRRGDDHDDHMPLEMPVDGWKPLATLAREVGVPEPSARRYAHAFAEFVQSRRIGKATLYHPDLGTLLRIAAEGFAAGRRRDEVAADLAARFGRVHDVVPQGGDDPATTPATPDRGDLAALLPLAERFVAVLERGVAALEAMAKNRAVEASREGGGVKGRGKGQTAVQGPPREPVLTRSREEIVREVLRLHNGGLGAYAIATTMRRAGWPTLSGRGQWGKGTVARILRKG